MEGSSWYKKLWAHPQRSQDLQSRFGTSVGLPWVTQILVVHLVRTDSMHTNVRLPRYKKVEHRAERACTVVSVGQRFTRYILLAPVGLGDVPAVGCTSRSSRSIISATVGSI